MGIHGKELEKAIYADNKLSMLIEGILPEEAVIQFFAGDGIGKSVLILQAELEATIGANVYGEFEVLRPLKICHIQTERSPKESYTRMANMLPVIKPNLENFYFEPYLQGLDISIRSDRLLIIDKLKAIKDEMKGLDWIHIDPIYAWTSADLATASGCGTLNDLLRLIQRDVCRTVSYNHHSNRGIKDTDTGQRKGEDMYGNRFLSANIAGTFHIKSRQGGGGTIWKAMKDSWSCLQSKIELDFDAQHFTSYVDCSKITTNKADRIVSFLKLCKAKNKTFSFDQFQSENEVSTTYARVQLSVQLNLGHILEVKSSGRKKLYVSKIG